MKEFVELQIYEEWLHTESLQLPDGIKHSQLAEFLDAPYTLLNFKIGVPTNFVPEGFEKSFRFRKLKDIKRTLSALDKAMIGGIQAIHEGWKKDQEGDDEGLKEAQAALTALNSLFKKTFDGLRSATRTAIAAEINGGLRPDAMQTIGTIRFKEWSLKAGAFETELEFDSPLLDLSAALKKKKWQNIGIAWKGDQCVVSVRAKKEFKAAELKELRDKLPEGGRGAKMVAAQFKAESATNVEIEFAKNDAQPRDILLRDAFKEQSGKQVFVKISVSEDEPKKDAGKNDDKKDKAKSGTKEPEKQSGSATKEKEKDKDKGKEKEKDKDKKSGQEDSKTKK